MHDLFSLLYKSETGLMAYRKIRRLLYREGKYIFIAAMPKSGSTYLSRAIAELTGYEHAYFAFAYRNIEQELYFPKVIDSYGRGTVVQQHVKANAPNINIFNQFKIRPIVLVRNIFDIVVSVKDHLSNERLDNLPSVYTGKQFLEFGTPEKYDFIIDNVIPWYISYYASWTQAEEEKTIDFLWLVYDEIIDDWASTLGVVMDFCQAPKSEVEIRNALNSMSSKAKSQTRINKGIKGRGQSELTDEQKERITRLTRYYPQVDFRRIGIQSNNSQTPDTSHI